MEKINIPKLVSDIKACEAARFNWRSYCEQNEIGKRWSEKFWWSPSYEEYVTALYTLRAWCRGKMHRKNPPATIRDFNRTMEEQGHPHRMTWDMEEHNRKIAEKTAERYFLEKSEPAPEVQIEPKKPKGLIQRIFG